MAYDPNAAFQQGQGIAKNADIGYNPNSKNASRYEYMDKNIAYGTAPDMARHSDEATYGGMHAKYDPTTGKMIQQSSAQTEADYYRQQAQQAQQRQGVRLNNAEQQRDYAGFQGQMGMSDASRAQQMGAYGQQQAATDQYAAMARGEGPSLARALMSQGQNNIRAAQTSAAASARGPAGLAMAQQNAAGNMAAQGQQLNAQLGQMRNQEQMAAMQGYAQGAQGLSSAAGQMRAQDQSGAGLYNQARAASMGNAQAQGQLEAQQRGLNDQYAGGNEQARMNVYKTDMDGSFRRRAADLESARYRDGQSASDSAQTAQMIGAGASTAAMMFSDVRAKTDVTPLDSSQQAGLSSLAGALSGKSGSLGSSFGALGGAIGGKIRESQAESAAQDDADLAAEMKRRDDAIVSQYARPSYFDSASMSGTAAPITYMQGPRSDERSKQKIASLSDALMRSQAAMYNAPSPIQETLRTTQPYAFNYKPGYGEDPGQRHVGIMAQDLEKTPAGSTLVKDGPKGKMIDGKQAVGFNLAAAADLQKQIDALKAERMAQSQMAMYSAPVAVRGQ